MLQSISNRSQYECLNEHIYLNQASLGLISRKAITSMHSFLDEIAQNGNLRMSDEEELNFVNPLRIYSSRLLNCDPKQLAILSSASEMLSQAPFLLESADKNEVVLVKSDFPSLNLPWIAYAKKNNHFVKFVEENIKKDLTSSILEQINKKTVAVVVSLVQFSTGTMVDIKKLRAETRAFGVKLVLDVTQAAGAIEIKSRDWNTDILVCSGYKWLGGHGGVALAVLSPEMAGKTPQSIGWMGSKYPFEMESTKLDLAQGVQKFTQGTMSYVSVRGLTVSIQEILRLSVNKIEKHSKQLAKILISKTSKTGWEVYSQNNEKERSSHILSLFNPNLSSTEVVRQLSQKKLICSSRNGRLRISLSHYNNESDLNTLINLLEHDE